MAPNFSITFKKSNALFKLIYCAVREEETGIWDYFHKDLAKEAQKKFSVKLQQMAVKIDGKTFLPQRSLKPLAFPVGNNGECIFKLSQFGIPIADVIPIGDNEDYSTSGKSNLVVELVDRGGTQTGRIKVFFN